ncbi:MAG: Methyltransferase domain protein [Frankiales bacterium]|nr:Methyltransferase domain protein [Frankiales bacterium]
MVEPTLNQAVLRGFWADKAREASNRWTSPDLLAYELSLLAPLAQGARSVLDLGSGHGDLSRRLCPPGTRLVAVDWEPGFATAYTEPEHAFVQSLVTDFRTDERFDLVLLFGVVTCLELAEELQVYGALAAHVGPGGVAVVKNQCSTGREFAVDTHSEALATRYSGRYPSDEEQQARLQAVFADIEVIHYPDQFNPWPNSRHLAFVCREPRDRAASPNG